uniref:Uncharacterized protein n=1 Tax=Avena sativa TaxID=4498 RepID=A0ACD5W7A2_AVESA
METAFGEASLLIRRLTNKLSDEFVAACVVIYEIDLDGIKHELMCMEALLRSFQGSGNNLRLRLLLEQLISKADEAEITLDELNYFTIKDMLDNTSEAHQVDRPHAFGNWLPSFPCSCVKKGTNSDSAALAHASMKIKSLREHVLSMSSIASDLQKLTTPRESTPVTLNRNRPVVGSTISQDRLYGRTSIFGKTVDYITTCSETLSVLPVVGPGGIGKTTFAQHLYNDTRTEQHFTVRVWVSVSNNDFDLLKLTRQIHACMPPTEEQGGNAAHETSNLDMLQGYIAQRLESERVLVVLDDIWECGTKENWKTLLSPFRETKGCMILVTTRIPNLAEMMKTADSLELQGLESNDFFKFFEACIFGELDKPDSYTADLSAIARDIAYKLKDHPLAAKTASRLLQRNISREHWMGVLENREWENMKNNGDFMSSLSASYDYLPFILQKCFSYCGLFPKGHRFSHSEMNRFLCAVGITDSNNQGHNSYFEGLVAYGFLMKGGDLIGGNYVMHDLLHDLSQSISAQECLNISGLDFKANTVPQSIRHLSITLEDTFDENFQEEMSKLKRRIDIVNLRTLMIFRAYEGRIAEILKDTFNEVNNLNVLFIVVKSLDELPQNFSKLIHLQYLKLGSPYGVVDIALPSTLSRFYHMKFLDLEDWHGSSNLPKDISRLVNLQDFLAKKELHSCVPEVGKMKYLRELKVFCVKKERLGFELRELGELTKLGGELSICNLENVATKEEASSARLLSKRNLRKLTLVWGGGQDATGSDILDGLQPHFSLRELGIVNHGGTTGPSWLFHLFLDISVKHLQSLHLEGLSWSKLPPLGQLDDLKELYLKGISGVRQLGPNYGGRAHQRLIHLKKIVFDDMPELVEWVVEPDSQMFPSLESIECRSCPNLCVMPLSDCSCTYLRSLHIDDCPKLSLHPMPFYSTLADFSVVESGSRKLTYSREVLVVCGYNGALDFRNLDKVKKMSIADISHISWTDLEKLRSVGRTAIGRRNSMTSEDMDGSVVFRSAQNQDHVERVIQFPSSSSLQTLSISGCTGMVLLPAEDGGHIQQTASLHSVTIFRCGKLFSRWPMGEAQTMKPFPSSLEKLGISSESSIESMSLLSNLTSLTHLTLQDCVKLTVDGFNPLITVNLKVLVVFNWRWDRSCPESVAAGLLSELASSRVTMPAGSFQLEQLKVDSISAVLVDPICNLIASTLHTLIFSHDQRAKNFTEQQEKALQLLTSLRHLRFDGCGALQSLPRGLHRLSSLQDLDVLWCPELRSIPKEGFPVSLRNLHVRPCSADVEEQIEKLRRKNPDLCVLYE